MPSAIIMFSWKKKLSGVAVCIRNKIFDIEVKIKFLSEIYCSKINLLLNL